MKIFHESKYKYMGIVDCNGEKNHAFHNIIFKDREIVLMERAKYYKKNGSVVYYDPVKNYKNNNKTYMTMEELLKTIDQEDAERLCDEQDLNQSAFNE